MAPRGAGSLHFGRLALAVSGVLGAAALLTYAQARRAERRHPPQGRFIDVDGVRLHYVERGAGPPVAFLHGNGGMIEDFEISGVLDLAARQYRVIAFDRPGFGHTNRPRDRAWTPAAQGRLLAKALTLLGAQKPIIVAHSWGTLAALAMAVAEPGRWRGLALISGYYFPTLRLDIPLASVGAVPVLGDILRHTVSPPLTRLAAPRLFRKIFAPAPVTDAFAADFPVALAVRPSQIRASAEDTAFMNPGARALRRSYRSLNLNILILAGAADELVSTDRHSRRLHHALPNSELRLIAGTGHMPHHQAPRAVIDAIDRLAAWESGTDATPKR